MDDTPCLESDLDFCRAFLNDDENSVASDEAADFHGFELGVLGDCFF